MNGFSGRLKRAGQRALAYLRLSRVARRALRDRLTYLSPQKLERIESSLRRLNADGVQGACVEFGVALGGSAIVIATLARHAGRKFFGLDVFAMIPPPTSDKDEEKAFSRFGVIAGGKAQGIGGDPYYGYRNDLLGFVVERLNALGLENATLIPGKFEDTWPTIEPGPIAFAHVDCDWYDPTKFCLEALAASLVPGGVIVIDDYHDYPGSKAATDEFISNHSGFVLVDGPNVILHHGPPSH